MVILNISRLMIAPTLKPTFKPHISPHFHIEIAKYIKDNPRLKPVLENEATVQNQRKNLPQYQIINILKYKTCAYKNITYILSRRMEHKIETKIIGWKQYQIQYERVNDNEVNLTVCNSQSRFKYASKNVGFKHINLKGFQAAVNGTNKDFALELKEVEDKAEEVVKAEKAEQGQREGQNSRKYLEFVVSFSSFILKKIEEVIRIPFHSKISAINFYKTNLGRISQRIAQIQAKNENNLKLVAGTLQSKQFKSNIDPNYGDIEGGSMDYQLIKLLDIRLPQYQKYQIQISMFLNCKQTYFYLYSDINYNSPLPNGAMLVPVCNQFIPIKLTFMIDNETIKQNLHTFYAYDIVDYPFLVQNLIVTALKVPK